MPSDAGPSALGEWRKLLLTELLLAFSTGAMNPEGPLNYEPISKQKWEDKTWPKTGQTPGLVKGETPGLRAGCVTCWPRPYPV